mmetsp:Transcript_4175/g.9285  ORF Transcript_4175/g.9285 Transcript_4175/m.9285 type:complete len:259 (-) Transcript_4175:841-1617(-)
MFLLRRSLRRRQSRIDIQSLPVLPRPNLNHALPLLRPNLFRCLPAILVVHEIFTLGRPGFQFLIHDFQYMFEIGSILIIGTPTSTHQQTPRLRPGCIARRSISLPHDEIGVHLARVSRVGYREGTQLPEQYAEGIGIHAEGIRHILGHFRCHVSQRPGVPREVVQFVIGLIGVGNSLGQPEIEHFERPIRVKSDIVGLQIPIDNVVPVQIRQRARDIPRHGEPLHPNPMNDVIPPADISQTRSQPVSHVNAHVATPHL